ncbi:MAG: hypothetical protein GC131_03385 [Alphaproteobacteria bacterium]|nr:hypothetical protein [Alphaproteobacteria bacterium]
MTEPAKATREEFEEELSTLSDAFRETRDLLRQGQQVDLSGLDERINSFCERLMGSDDATKQGLLPGLSSMLVELEQLENQLRRAQDTFERSRAAGAYGNAPGAEPDDKDNK